MGANIIVWVLLIVGLLLKIMELPFMIWGWVSFFINSLLKSVSQGCLIFIIPSLILWPIDMVCLLACSCLIYLRIKTLGERMGFKDAVSIYLNRFPQL